MAKEPARSTAGASGIAVRTVSRVLGIEMCELENPSHVVRLSMTQWRELSEQVKSGKDPAVVQGLAVTVDMTDQSYQGARKQSLVTNLANWQVFKSLLKSGHFEDLAAPSWEAIYSEWNTGMTRFESDEERKMREENGF